MATRSSLGFDGGWWFGGFGRDSDGPEATITMPALDSIALSGASQRVVLGLRRRRACRLASSGAAEIRGDASRFDALSLELSGAGNADLDECRSRMQTSPSAAPRNVSLRMAGGRLTGDMSGAGNLAYLRHCQRAERRHVGLRQRSAPRLRAPP